MGDVTDVIDGDPTDLIGGEGKVKGVGRNSPHPASN